MQFKSIIGVSALALGLGLGGPAWAEQADPAPSQGPTGQGPVGKDAHSGIEDIVVTARRIAESIQSVPITITALTSGDLVQNSVLNLGDINRLTPGLFYTNDGSNRTNPTLRGAGSYAAGDAVLPVVTYFAEVPLGGGEGTPPVFDLANVQVLKGPQGTLFGRNAYAGAVLLTPRAPNFDLGGYVRLSGGTYDYHAAEGALNVPIIGDKVALRVSGLYQRRDGYTKLLNAPDGNDLHEDNLRASLLVQPTDDLKITEILDYRHKDAVGTVPVSLGLSPFLVGTAQFLAPALYDCPSGDPSCNVAAALAQALALAPYAANFGTTRPREKLKDWGSTTKIVYNLGGVELVNIFGYRSNKGESHAAIDGLGLDVPLFFANSFNDDKQLSEEFHVNGYSFNTRLKWIVGGFYSRLKENIVGGLNLFEGAQAALPAGSPAQIDTASLIYRTNITKAVFGQVTWDFSNVLRGLSLDVGGRYNWDNKDSCFRIIPFYGFVPPQTPTGDPLAGREDCGVTLAKTPFKGHTPTWNVTLNYRANNDLFFYLTSRRGYREGSLNIPDLSATILRDYQSAAPEKVTDVEGGVKADWRKGGVAGRLDLAVYHGWYRGVQIGVPTGVLSTPAYCPGPLCVPANEQPNGSDVNINAGSQQVTGGEASVVVRPTRSLTLDVGAAYTHLDSTNFVVPVFAVTPLVSIFSPKWTVNAALTYTLPIHPLDPKSNLVFHTNFYHSGSLLIRGTLRTPAWDQTDVRLDWTDIAGSNVTLSAYVTNVFDKANAIFESDGGGAGIDIANYNPPRMFAVDLNVDF